MKSRIYDAADRVQKVCIQALGALCVGYAGWLLLKAALNLGVALY